MRGMWQMSVPIVRGEGKAFVGRPAMVGGNLGMATDGTLSWLPVVESWAVHPCKLLMKEACEDVEDAQRIMS